MLTAKYFTSTATFIMCTAEYITSTATYNILTAKPYKPMTTIETTRHKYIQPTASC